jgi:hypothetical protein
VPPTPYGHLVIGGNSGTKTLGGGLQLQETLLLMQTITFQVAGNNLTVNGTTSVSGTITNSAASGTYRFVWVGNNK